VIDCYSKKIIGRPMDDHYQTPLITAAITHAASRTTLTPGAVFHSDRGSKLHFVRLRESPGRSRNTPIDGPDRHLPVNRPIGPLGGGCLTRAVGGIAVGVLEVGAAGE